MIRAITYAMVGVAVVLLEASALATVLVGGHGDWTLALFLFQHAAASALLALFVRRFLPQKYRHPRWLILALLFNFAFFTPVLGLLGMLAAAFLSSYRLRIAVAQPFTSVKLPEFELSQHETDAKFSQGGIKARLAEFSLPVSQRLEALLALQDMPAHVSSPMLQDMLGDVSDDIRLVAYGLIDSREKRINAQIHHELTNLKGLLGNNPRLISLRHLAELYWELVYAGLAQGDLRAHALRQALHYTNHALLLAPRDTGMWFLKGRILHEMKEDEEAFQAFGLTVAYGLPEARVLPYIVEIFFNRSDYRAVRDLLMRIPDSQTSPRMKAAIRFWVGEPESFGLSAEGAAV